MRRNCSAIQLWSALTGRNHSNLFKSNKSSELFNKKRNPFFEFYKNRFEKFGLI